MKLLTPIPPAELPEEALLARVRYRRAGLRPAAGDAEGSAADASRWVYQRLNRRLRRRLDPAFELVAMRSLVLTLRYAFAGEALPPGALRGSLLSDGWPTLLAAPGETEAKVARLEAALAEDYAFAEGLARTHRGQGPGGVEQQLAEGILRDGLARARDEALATSFRYLIDTRNLLMVRKLWRWQVRRAPPLTEGGAIAAAALQRIWSAGDSAGLMRLAAQLARQPLASTETAAMEQCLLNGLTTILRDAGRDPLGIGLVLEYLWRAQLTVHNQTLRQALGAERPELLEEVLLS